MKKRFNNYLNIFFSVVIIVLCIISLISRPDYWTGNLNIAISILDITLCVVLAVGIVVEIIDIVKTKKKTLKINDKE